MKFIVLAVIFFIVPSMGYAGQREPVLNIQTSQHHIIFSRSELMAMKNVTQVTISNNRAYPGKTMTYTSIKLCELLKPYAIDPSDTLEFIASDQFAVLIPAAKIMSCGADDPIAYLAIEPEKKWPLLSSQYGDGVTAGPFDVIWLNLEKTPISDEYWAWSVVKIKAHQDLDKNVYLAAPVVADKKMQSQLKHGYDVYISHCAACHAMNHMGKGVIGPDLNIPKSAVEYYPDDAVLKKFIRDPQSVRGINKDRMSGSSRETLPEKDLNALIFYFHYMAKHKILQ